MNKRESVFLDDFPSDRDEFGGHERVAQAIADLASSEHGGRAIGLEGGWGSGKSTTVELLKRKLPAQIFVYDAWSHKDDPLRRVFLEKLIAFFLRTKPHLDAKRWDQTVEELAKRSKVTDVLPTIQLKPLGVLTVLFTLLVPPSTALFAVGIQSATGNLPRWLFWLGLGGVLSLPVLFLILYIVSYLRNRKLPP